MKKLIIILIAISIAIPAIADEMGDLAMQYIRFKALKTYYEGKIEQIVVNMDAIEQRSRAIKSGQLKSPEIKTEDKKENEKAIIDRPDP